MPNVLQLMPALEGDEMAFIQNLLKDMNDDEAQQFAISYMARRKDPTNLLIFAIVGLLGSYLSASHPVIICKSIEN